MATLDGNSSDATIPGVTGENKSSGGSGFLGGTDPVFGQKAGVYGQSDQQGVIGRALGDAGTGVHGSGPGSAFGVRGETESGIGMSGLSSSGVGVKGVCTRREGGIGDSGIGVLGEGFTQGIVGRTSAGVGVQAESVVGFALVATTTGGNGSVLVLNQINGSGNLITGQITDGQGEREVFLVKHSGDVLVRGVELTSDRNAKTNFSSVDTIDVLESLARIPINKWTYKTDSDLVQHVGPTSQDFQEAFGLNGGDKFHISTVDAQGVALAAIQGLNEKLNAENTQLRASLENINARLAALERA